MSYDDGRVALTDDALIIELAGKGARPVITPDQPDEVVGELSAHGIDVTTA